MAPSRTSEPKGGRESASPPPLTWESLLPDLSAPERGLLPDLLESIYLPLVAPTATGPTPARVDPAELIRQWLAGSTTPLVGTARSDGPDGPDWLDTFNDRIGSAAFDARHTPDGYLIRGAGGTGKTAVLREMWKSSGSYPQDRVLMLGGTAPATRNLLRTLLPLYTLRTAATPSETVLDWSAWTTNLSAILFDRVEAGIASRDEDRRFSERQLADLERLHHLPGDLLELESARAGAATALPHVRESLERELAGADDSPFRAERTAYETTHLARFAGQTALLEVTQAEMAALQAERADLDTRHAQLEPLHLACENARWWSGDYWKAKLDKSRLGGFKTLCDRRAAVEARLSELQLLRQHAEVETREAPSTLERRQKSHFDDGLARRTAALRAILDDADTRVPEMRAEIESLRKDRFGRFEEPGPFTPAEYETLRTALAVSISQDRQAVRLLGRFRQAAAGRENQLVPWLRNGIRLVVGTVDSVASDPFLNDPACPRFDYLMIDEAADLTESQFVSLARRADRWVMTSACSLPPVSEEPRRHPGRSSGPLPPRRGDLFARLWAVLHKPTWSRERGRLLCRLETVVAADRQYLEAEPVADNPQIEVRIFSPKDGDPRVAEVLFPEDFSPVQARTWLKIELDEIALQPASAFRHWNSADDKTRVNFYTPRPPLPTGEAVELGSGVVETVAGLDTLELTFTGPEWTLEKATEWVQTRTARSSSARTCELRDSLRTLSETLCSRLRAVFGINLHYCGSTAPDEEVFRFVEVPALGERDRKNPHEVRGGSGLELELSEPRGLERIPSAILSRLPASGPVNPTEAEAMLAEARTFVPTSLNHNLVLTALYPAQVQLLRELAADAPLPSGVQILAPEEIPSEGACVLMVGLTRSHASRAVPFGESPELILRLVTLARQRLVIFGDPATLVRRSQWDKPLDPLDASASDRESRWVGGLVDSILGRG